MIDLAPHNPYGLSLRSPVLIAPGCAGTGVGRALDPHTIGAVATRTAVRHASSGTAARWASTPAGIVFERLPTTSLRQLVKDEARRWARSPLPVLLHLAGTLDELAEMVSRIEPLEGVGGLILQSDPIDPAATVAELRTLTPLPLLVVLPQTPELARAAHDVADAGADAVIACAYPSITALDQIGAFQGVLVGPVLAPWTLQAISAVAASVTVPLVAYGGVANGAIAQQCLAAGAHAVMIDGALYGDAAAAHQIAATLLRRAATDAAQS